MPIEQNQEGGLGPVTLPRSGHCISRTQISANALKVLYRLNKAEFQSYLVGGAVRDLLLGREPKDFDVATDARPEEIKDLFRNCRLIGRRFRLAHVHFGAEIIEVATFRGPGTDPGEGKNEGKDVRVEDGMITHDNAYGSLEEDAWRRDFTVNALYYNIHDFSVSDFVGGLHDLEAGLVRPIGDPRIRFREDPVRMLRAIRFAAKLGFRIEPESIAAMRELGETLLGVPPARLFDEVLKIFLGGSGQDIFKLLRDLDLFSFLFPLTESSLKDNPLSGFQDMLLYGLKNTDERVLAEKPVTPAFLYACLLWPAFYVRWQAGMAAGQRENEALHQAAEQVINAQMERIALPRRFTVPMKEIWALQNRFLNRKGRRAVRLLGHPRFRAAYDFLLIRAQGDPALTEVAQWWTDIQTLEEPERIKKFGLGGHGRLKKRRRGKKEKTAGNGKDSPADIGI